MTIQGERSSSARGRWVAGAAGLTGVVALVMLGVWLRSSSANPYVDAVEDIGLQKVVVARSAPADPWMKSIGDLDGDGRLDLIVGGATGPVIWYRNPGWQPTTIANAASSQSGSAVGDIDGDGDSDVVVGTTWYENRDHGEVWSPHRLGQGGTHDIVLGDFDSDGKLDVAMRGENGSEIDVFFQKTGDTWERMRLDPGVGRNGLATGDLDRDRDADLVIGGVWLANPGGKTARLASSWTTHRFASWNPWAGVAVADVNRDGHQDVVLTVSEKHGDAAWFDAPANPAQGTWTRHAIGTGLDSVHSVDVADMDGDGRPDVVLSEFRGAGRLLVFHNERLGLMWTPFTVERGENLHNTRVADLNGDGLPDVFGAAPFGKQPAIAYLSSRAHATRILVFSKTLGFRHDSIPHAVTTLKQMGSANGFTVDATEDSRAFTPSNLDRYRAVVFLNPSGDVLDAAERRSLRRYVEQGHGFVGIHNATALVLEDWRWYTRLVGARYVSEIRTQPLRLVPVDKSDPSTRSMPDPWLVTEEAYNFDINPKKRGVTVLVNLDESYSKGGTMGADHPFSWRHAYDGGRSWYTNGGANKADYDNPVFLAHVLGGIRWAAQLGRAAPQGP